MNVYVCMYVCICLYNIQIYLRFTNTPHAGETTKRGDDGLLKAKSELPESKPRPTAVRSGGKPGQLALEDIASPGIVRQTTALDTVQTLASRPHRARP